ncbi:MAG: TauD/TfdA family dioxygenase, partial [Pseudomonadota bacterium]|nr:TauD/TfdA family dioxygenase [Pseudomonadota bacterium]
MIDVRPKTDRGFFAEIYGANLKDCSDADFAIIKDAHLTHGVIAIRDQDLTPAQQISFSKRFGPLSIHVLEEQLLAGHPEILLVTNKKENGRFLGIPDLGRKWHTDQSYEERPALGSLLYALEVPEDGSGDTWFADMTAAYEALPAEERRRLDEFEAEHRYDHKHKNFKLSDNQIVRLPGVLHPLVRTHPKTRRKALYLGVQLVKRIVGLAADESDRLLADLHTHCTKPEFVYCHKWRKGDLVFWDNRCTMHAAQP